MRRGRRVTAAAATAVFLAASACGGGGGGGLGEALAAMPVDDQEGAIVTFSTPRAALAARGVEGEASTDDAVGLLLDGLLFGDRAYSIGLGRSGELDLADLDTVRGFGLADVEAVATTAIGSLDVLVGPDPEAVVAAGDAAGSAVTETGGLTTVAHEGEAGGALAETLVTDGSRVWLTGEGSVELPPEEGGTVADLAGVAEVVAALEDHAVLVGTVLTGWSDSGSGAPAWKAAAFGRAAADDVVWVVAAHDDDAGADATAAQLDDLDALRAMFGSDVSAVDVTRDGTTVVAEVAADATAHVRPLQTRALDALVPDV